MGSAPETEIATGGGKDAYETVLKKALHQVRFTACLDTMKNVALNAVASTYFNTYASPRAHKYNHANEYIRRQIIYGCVDQCIQTSVHSNYWPSTSHLAL